MNTSNEKNGVPKRSASSYSRKNKPQDREPGWLTIPPIVTFLHVFNNMDSDDDGCEQVGFPASLESLALIDCYHG